MNKEDRQIEWKEHPIGKKFCWAGFYNNKNIIDLALIYKEGWEMRLLLPKSKYISVGSYATAKSAKRGAERFLKRLQEAVK